MKIDIPANTKTVILNIVGDEMIELKKKVEEAKQVLGLKKNWNLSEAMGHQGRYIDRVLRDGVSTNKQKEIVKTLNTMIDLHKVDAECEKEIDNPLAYICLNYHNQEISRLKKQLNESNHETIDKHTEYCELKARFNSIQDKNNSLLIVINDHEQEKSKLKTEIQRLQAELVSVHSDHRDMFNDGQIKNFQINCLSKDVDEEKANVRMLNGEVAELGGRVELWKVLAWLTLITLGFLNIALGLVA